MEKVEFVKDGVLRLPPGFRFHPTDEELVVQYLRRKALSRPLPAAVIPEIDLGGKYDPWDLPGEPEGERYFFSLREAKYRNGTRSSRATCSGYWKATGRDKRIVASGTQLVGMKKVLVFYQGKPTHGARTDWVMHEYRLAGTPTTTHDADWVVCRIFMKNRTTEMKEVGRHRDFRQARDFTRQRNSSAYSCSDSSCVTELCDDSTNGDEADSKSIVSSPCM